MEHANTKENIREQDSLPYLFNQLIEKEPKLVTNFVPADAMSQKEAFITGDICNPSHQYPKLADINYQERYDAFDSLGAEIENHPEMNSKFTEVYADFIDGYKKKTRLMELSRDFKAADDEQKPILKEAYMALNIELYGKPDKETFEALLGEKLLTIYEKPLSGQAAKLRDELFEMVEFDPTQEVPKRFMPSRETVDWMKGVAESLYGGMLAHVPEQGTFEVHEIQQIFSSILSEEFAGAAEVWQVDIEPAKAINVKATEKRIVIPEDKTAMSRDALRLLVVHELGVHMMRAITGAETDLHPLGIGVNDYYDAEEGLGVVMEQAIKGEFSERGSGHYITAGLAYHNDMDFRDTYEVKWRLAALEKATEQSGIEDLDLAKIKNTAYGSTMRIFRGTDELPWFKDLSYYNGSAGVWRHLEEIRGDDVQFMFVLMGKSNPANIGHLRVMLETATR